MRVVRIVKKNIKSIFTREDDLTLEGISIVKTYNNMFGLVSVQVCVVTQ